LEDTERSERAENRWSRAWSGRGRKRWSGSGARSGRSRNGNGVVVLLTFLSSLQNSLTHHAAPLKYPIPISPTSCSLTSCSHAYKTFRYYNQFSHHHHARFSQFALIGLFLPKIAHVRCSVVCLR